MNSRFSPLDIDDSKSFSKSAVLEEVFRFPAKVKNSLEQTDPLDFNQLLKCKHLRSLEGKYLLNEP